MTLSDLLTGQQDPAARYASFGANGGGGVMASSSGIDPMVEAQIAAASQPDQVPDMPSGKSSKLWQRIASALADAGSAYAGRPSAYTQAMVSRDEELNQEKIRHGNLVAGANNRAKKTGAEMRLRAILSKQENDLRSKADDIAESKAAKLLQDKIKRDQDEEASRRAFELAKMAQDHSLDQQEQGARFKHEEGMKRLEASLKTGDDPKAEKALQSFSLGSRIANGILRGVPESKDGPAIPPLAVRLAGDPENKIAPETPEQLRREFEDEMTQEGIFGPARDLTRDYFNERLIRTYRESQKAAQPQNSGP